MAKRGDGCAGVRVICTGQKSLAYSGFLRRWNLHKPDRPMMREKVKKLAPSWEM